MVVNNFQWILEEFIFPPMPCNNCYWPSRESGIFISTAFYLVLTIIKIAFIINCGLLVKRRMALQRGWMQHPLVNKILHHQATNLFLRTWVPIRVLAPNVVDEIGSVMAAILEAFPHNTRDFLINLFHNTCIVLQLLEIAILIVAAMVLLDSKMFSRLKEVVYNAGQALSDHNIHMPHLHLHSPHIRRSRKRDTHHHHHEPTHHEMTRHGTAHHATTGLITPHHEPTHHTTAGHGTTHHPTTSHGATGHRTTDLATRGHGTTHHATTGHGTTHQATTGHAKTHHGTTGHSTTKHGPTHHATSPRVATQPATTHPSLNPDDLLHFPVEQRLLSEALIEASDVRNILRDLVQEEEAIQKVVAPEGDSIKARTTRRNSHA